MCEGDAVWDRRTLVSVGHWGLGFGERWAGAPCPTPGALGCTPKSLVQLHSLQTRTPRTGACPPEPSPSRPLHAPGPSLPGSTLPPTSQGREGVLRVEVGLLGVPSCRNTSLYGCVDPTPEAFMSLRSA